MDISASGMDSYSFTRALVAKEKVAVAPGATYGPSADRYVRVSYCVAKGELVEGLGRLCSFIAIAA